MQRALHQTTITLSGIACLVVAACGSQGGPGQPSVSERWSTLSLPPSGGAIIYADAEVLTARHSSADVMAIAARYSDALTAHGHTRILDLGRPPLAASRWATPAGGALDLAVTPHPDGVTAHVTDVPGLVP